MNKHYFEDFQVGDVVELGNRTVSEAEIIDFATQFDPQPFHIDREKAKDSFFGGIIASGWHTASLLMRMLVDEVLNGTISLGSPGLEELRWIQPVRPGDTLHGRFTILEASTSKSRPNLGILRCKNEMLNQNGEVVMSFTSTGFFGRKPQSGSEA